jgi:hypothetical protein
MFDDLSNEFKQYLNKIDGVSEEETWTRPKYIDESLFNSLKSIQLKLRYFLSQNENEMNETITENSNSF